MINEQTPGWSGAIGRHVFSAEEIDAMTLEQFEANRAEIMRQATGKPEPTAWPAGHVFSEAEVARMTIDEFETHRAEIMRQMRAGLIRQEVTK